MQAKADRSQVLESDIFVQSSEHAQHILTDIQNWPQKTRADRTLNVFVGEKKKENQKKKKRMPTQMSELN